MDYCKQEGFDLDIEEYHETIGDIPAHWTQEITKAYIVQLLKVLCVQGVWDLGLYCRDVDGNNSLPVYCPFDKQFYLFWESHDMGSLFVDGKEDCCDCAKKKRVGPYTIGTTPKN